MTALLNVEDVTRVYTVHRGALRKPAAVHALAGVSFALDAGKTLAVVGESGCGKSTLARIVTLLEAPTTGTVSIDGRAADPRDPATRRAVQMVFQDPYGSLNPRMTVARILEEPLVIAGEGRVARRAAAREMLARVGLRQDHLGRYPHMFSGGQRQRIAIARALMLNPRIVVADEPVSALDVSVRAQVLNLLADLQDEFHLAYIFISHDLSVVAHIADSVLVMYLGHVVEYGTRDAIFHAPAHPYTRALLASTPGRGTANGAEPVTGEPPSPLDPPSGCAYHTRCLHATERCAASRPLLRPVNGRSVACHHAETLGAA